MAKKKRSANVPREEGKAGKAGKAGNREPGTGVAEERGADGAPDSLAVVHAAPAAVTPLAETPAAVAAEVARHDQVSPYSDVPAETSVPPETPATPAAPSDASAPGGLSGGGKPPAKKSTAKKAPVKGAARARG